MTEPSSAADLPRKDKPARTRRRRVLYWTMIIGLLTFLVGAFLFFLVSYQPMSAGPDGLDLIEAVTGLITALGGFVGAISGLLLAIHKVRSKTAPGSA